MTTRQSEVGAIRRIIIKHAKDAFASQARIDAQWEALNYTSAPVFEQAVAEYDQLVELLQRFGMEVHFLPAGEETGMDSLYPRDNAIVTDKGAILCHMGKGARRKEPGQLAALFEALDVPIHGEIAPPGTIEGGDVAWVDENTLAVGRGYRTNDEGIRQLKVLARGSFEVVAFHLPHWLGPSDVFHLMSVFSPIDKDLAVVHSPLMPVPLRELLVDRGYQFVECPREEFDTLGCNVLAVAPRVALIPAGNPQTAKALREQGCQVHEFDGYEISLKGCGGPTCLTRPLERG